LVPTKIMFPPLSHALMAAGPPLRVDLDITGNERHDPLRPTARLDRENIESIVFIESRLRRHIVRRLRRASKHGDAQFGICGVTFPRQNKRVQRNLDR
jgi:hypothetical protein